MNYENFGLARDLLYLTALFIGLSTGAFLLIKTKSCTLRRRSQLITVILFLAAFAVTSLAVAVILTRGQVFSVVSIYLFFAIFLVFGIIGLYIPRVGISIIIALSGLYIVLISFSFLVYPRINDLDPLLVRATDESFVFRHGADMWDIQDTGGAIRFEAVCITPYPGYPLIGGEQRGILTQVSRANEQLFSLRNRNLSILGMPGFVREYFTLDLPEGFMLPGFSLSVLFNGTELFFEETIQFDR